MKYVGRQLHLTVILFLSLCCVDSMTAVKDVIAAEEVRDKTETTSSATTTSEINNNNSVKSTLYVDPNGYLIYCPCMGRFGNQADHFLGSLGFAKKINRTLVIPPWRTYKNVPFDEWFKADTIQQYHKAILAETFMQELAPTVWPEGKRIGWCWLSKPNVKGENYCAMKEGNPFGPFWDGLGVNFDGYMAYDFSYTDIPKWNEVYPGSKYPVIALKGAPASFPIRQEDIPLQRYLQWSAKIEDEASDYIQSHFPHDTFVGIHLRNGQDWEKACEHAKGTRHFMASQQCMGFDNTKEISQEICLPSANTIISLTKAVVEKIKATIVYIATDKDPMLPQLQAALGDQVRLIHQDPWLPQIDLAILGKADHFIGNCVSSFTSFVTRERWVKSKPTSFWGFSLPSEYTTNGL